MSLVAERKTSARREQVLALREEGMTLREIAERLGLSRSYVSHLSGPNTYENSARMSREAKARRQGKCERCGGPTRYDGIDVARICSGCVPDVYWPRYRADFLGKGKVVEKLLAFVAEPHTFTEIRLHLGITAGHTSSLLHRHLRTGLVVRLRRGVYQRADRKASEAA